MADIVNVDMDTIYRAWRLYVKGNSKAKYFGTDNDLTKAKFPYANLMLVGKPTDKKDLENHEITVDLTLQTDCYIDKQVLSDLYDMDDACWAFFQELGFSRMGNTALTDVQNMNVKRIISRFTLRNFNGRFLRVLE